MKNTLTTIGAGMVCATLLVACGGDDTAPPPTVSMPPPAQPAPVALKPDFNAYAALMATDRSPESEHHVPFAAGDADFQFDNESDAAFVAALAAP